MSDARKKKRASPALWVSSTYFAEGFPYAIVNNLVEILFKDLGASLRVIGLTSLFHLPWNLKFLWGPLLDQYETKRRWLIGVELGICATLVLVTLLVGSIQAISFGLILGVSVLALLSATHDIAIDGFYLEALDEKEQSAYVGWRATFYRIAALLVVGPLLVFYDKAGWFAGLCLVSGVMMAITAYHFWILPRNEERRAPIRDLTRTLLRPRLLLSTAAICILVVLFRTVPWFGEELERALSGLAAIPWIGALGFSDWVVFGLLLLLVLGGLLGKRRVEARSGEGSAYRQSFVSFMKQDRAGMILAFVVLFRTGESFLMKMRWPFLTDVVHMSKAEYGLYNGMIGVGASFGTTLAGGWLIARYGLRRCIWPFVMAQNVLNLLYMWLGLLDQPEALSALALGGVIAVEHAGAGLGTAVFMVFLMRACDPRHKAGHMAILTALMSVSFTIAGVFSGYLAEALGFSAYFGMTFLATVPSMLLIPFLPYLDGRTKVEPKTAVDPETQESRDF